MLYLRKTQDFGVRYVTTRLMAGRNRNYSKDYESSDDEKDQKKSKIKQEKTAKVLPIKETSIANEETALEKLNRVLASMNTVDNKINFVKYNDVAVAKPGEASRKRKVQQKQEAESKDILAAAKKVASLLVDNKQQQQQTESELLTRLLGGTPTAQRKTSEEQKLTSNESDLSLSELIVGMKIDRRPEQKVPNNTRSEYVRRNLANKGYQQQQYKGRQDLYEHRRPLQRKREAEIFTGSVNLSGGEPLGIFTDPSSLKDSSDLLPTWSYLYKEALLVQVSHPPSNYFEKLIRWTDQGKVWRFPIDNEQDWLNEKNVDFSEHIFLENHLEGWCPNRGPVRHFMELVCVGLSKNPYITAQEKKDHIMWYKNYFESKRDILKELMSKEPQDNKNIGAQKQKQVEG